ncbi:MAG TPA: hypothetical protein V6C81_31565 [Planktothrix sp.]|jgi:hypothetical protein
MRNKLTTTLITSLSNSSRVIALSLLLALSGTYTVPCSAATLSTRPNEFSWLPLFCDHQIRQVKLSADIQKLKDYDVVVIIDKSRSMLVEDCQADLKAKALPISRWQWCRRQTLDIARQALGVLPQHFRVVTFANDWSVYDNVDPAGVDMIFGENTPSGPTKAAEVLRNQIDDYFARRAQQGENAKPLLVAMITDGCPDNPSAFKYAITHATSMMSDPDEVKISLLQVGHDERATKLIADLQGLVQHGAKYDIVRTQTFDQVQQAGLVRSLADAVAPTAAKADSDRSQLTASAEHRPF